MPRVRAVLEAMGFRPIREHDSFISYMRFEVEGRICVLILDGGTPDLLEEDLVRVLANNGVDLAQFWNLYDAQEQ
jgi:hypothetical protein